MKRFLLFLFLLMACSPIVRAQRAAERLYEQGVACMQVLNVQSQKRAIHLFGKAYAAFDSKEKKKLCSSQVKVCRNILRRLTYEPQSNPHPAPTNEKDKKKNSQTAFAAAPTVESEASPETSVVSSSEAVRRAPKNIGGTVGRMVDLGLSVLWADHNVGAEKAEECGGLYGWADASGNKTSTNDADYPHDKTPLTNISARKAYDLPRAQWGGAWRLPSRQEFEELEVCCSWKWEKHGEVGGYRVTGPNGASIFLPAAGHRKGHRVEDVGEHGFYWTGEAYIPQKGWAVCFMYNNTAKGIARSQRHSGKSIRPVCAK